MLLIIDVLARLDDREYRNARKLAQASLNELTAQWQQAGRDRRRIKRLTVDNVASVSDLEKAVTRENALKASVQAAEARLAEADRRLQETVLKAPFDGTVTNLNIQAGEWAVPGQPVVELTGDGPVELVVEVPESVVLHIETGQRVTVVLPFAAVVNPGVSRPFIFIYKDGHVTRKGGRVNRIVEDRIVVKGALEEGEKVVISGQSQLSDGDAVKVAL